MKMIHTFLTLLTFTTTLTLSFAAQAKYDKVFVQCAVVQGNGLNWASTLGWLSAEVAQMAEKAQVYERNNSGKTAGVDLSCLTGSSSGSFVSAMMDRLLRNPNVTGRTDTRRKVLTAKRAQSVAEALHYLSLTTHSSLGSLAATFRQPKRIRNKFLKVVAVAQHYHPDWNNYPVRRMDVFNSRDDKNGGSALTMTRVTQANKLRKRFGLESLTSTAQFASRAEMDSVSRNNRFMLDKIMHAFMEVAKSQADAKLRGTNRTANVQIGDDFCVTAFVIPESHPSYDQLRIAFICNKKTFDKLNRSSYLQSLLKKSRFMQHRLLLAWTDKWNEAVNISMREPGLMAELSGTVKQIGLSQLVGKNAKATYAYTPGKQVLTVIGGFPGPRMQSWAATALLQERMANLRGQGIPAQGRLVIFGKTEKRDDPTSSFAQKTINSLFTDADAGEVTPELRSFYKWQDDLCPAVDQLPKDIIVDFYRMDWNLKGQNPAATRNASHILTAKGRNLVQIQTNFKKHQSLSPIHRKPLDFDKIDELIYAPEPPRSGMKCRL